MIYSGLIKADIEKIRQEANFTAEQDAVFAELIKPSYGVTDCDTAVYMRLNMSRAKYYRIKSVINHKIIRILS